MRERVQPWLWTGRLWSNIEAETGAELKAGDLTELTAEAAVTIKDVAREADVSYSTVSRVVNNYKYVNPDTREKVIEAMERLGYIANQQARSLVKATVPRLSGRTSPCEKGCHHALDNAIITQPEARDPEVVARLDAVAGRLLRG